MLEIEFNNNIIMATPYPSTLIGELDRLSPEEVERLEKRRSDVMNYRPPKWRSNCADDVSGEPIEQAMVDHASILTDSSESFYLL